MPQRPGRPLALAVAALVAAACAARHPHPASGTAPQVVAPGATPVVVLADDTTGCDADAECAAWAITSDCGQAPEYRAVSIAKARGLAEAIERQPVFDSSGAPCSRLRSADERVALCENHRCELYDAEAALRWVASVVPAFADFAPNPKLSPNAAPWYVEGARISLFVRGDWRQRQPLPAACVGIDFTAQGGTLFADLDDHGLPAPRVGCSQRLSLEYTVDLYDNGCRGPDGGSWPGGVDVGMLDRRVLSTADAAGLIYGAHPGTLTPRCRWSSIERPGCAESCRTCSIVLSYWFETGGGGAYAGLGPVVTAVSRPTCGPCLPDRDEQVLPRVAAILRGRSFLDVPAPEENILRFFRSKSDCDAYVHSARSSGRTGR
jgi:hypothetical protein